MLNYTHTELLVETEWLMEHLADPNIRIVAVDVSPEPFNQAHIPGAVFWNIFTDLLLPDLRLNLDPAAFSALMTRSGITNQTTVIAYGSYPGTGAWIFWLLKLFGHEHLRVLNGGYQKWIAEARPLTDQSAGQAASGLSTPYQAKAPDASLRVLQPEVQAAIERDDCQLLDVRTPQEYAGKIFLDQPPHGNERAGHIPQAVHLDHIRVFNEDGTFKSAEALRALFTSSGILPNQTIFPYCAIGGRSASIWFILKYLLGYPNVRNYDGSWNEWSRIAGAPVA